MISIDCFDLVVFAFDWFAFRTARKRFACSAGWLVLRVSRKIQPNTESVTGRGWGGCSFTFLDFYDKYYKERLIQIRGKGGLGLYGLGIFTKNTTTQD